MLFSGPQVHTQVLHQGAADPEGGQGLLEHISKDHSAINRTWKFQGMWLPVAMLSRWKIPESSSLSSNASRSVVQCSLYLGSTRPLPLVNNTEGWFIVFLLIFRLWLLCVTDKNHRFLWVSVYSDDQNDLNQKGWESGQKALWAIKGHFNSMLRDCCSSSSFSFLKRELSQKAPFLNKTFWELLIIRNAMHYLLSVSVSPLSANIN